MSNKTTEPLSREGTPRTLSEAIQIAMCIAPMGTGNIEHTVQGFSDVIYDYLAQRFQVAMFQCSKQDQATKDALQRLWEDIGGKR